MAGQIRISPDTMRERANQYRREADTVDGVIKNMDKLLAQLQSEFEGEASKAFSERYQELKPGFVKAVELIQEIANKLDETAKIMEETDIKLSK